jgi:hypothetical protein
VGTQHGANRRSSGANRKSKLPLYWLVSVSVMLNACGRKATAKDCERIVGRIAELQLGAVVPASELDDKVRETQAEFRQQALSDCVGRRITDRSLECLSNAETANAAVTDCFD